MVSSFFDLLFLFKNKPIFRELVNNMNTPYYPIQFKKIFYKIFQKNNTMMIPISKRLKIMSNT